MTSLEWYKSSYSGNDGPDCVEVAIPPADPTVHVRDSKDTTRPHLSFTDASWTAFLHTVATADRPA
ncbi:putative DNA-binding protein [Streptomyces ambofaciens ATCC 23877]|uniref:DUF397 domain-containing protein n=2 Tax=Streptomyces ambofaciens TaxID=1889 RepID=A0ABM6AZW3_STRAM|nr:DUF397 domain-containing protein [Streptomyces ambofaciens]AKZ56347.1 putative DNA-binding protein [Streptomyces ambofaciens ATCC 23877]ANB06958.1 hypothetical protein SAM40697_3000 [Streptomyces ambofaciens]